MKHSPINVPCSKASSRSRLLTTVGTLIIGLQMGFTQAQIVETGQTARPFTIFDHETKDPISLSDFEGQILVLDFFAHWCGPCRASSPDLQENVANYYESRGGNANGIPVSVVPVNVEDGAVRQTQDFIDDLGLTNVAEDLGFGEAYGQFQTGFIPLFVIINGATDSSTHRPWEVLYRSSGYPGADALHDIIDSVESDPTAPPAILQAPSDTSLLGGESLELAVSAAGAPPRSYQWLLNGTPIAGATNTTLSLRNVTAADEGDYSVSVSNPFGTVESDPTRILVYDSVNSEEIVWQGRPKQIPDDSLTGITESLQLPAQASTIVRIQLRLEIEHSYQGDLTVRLEAPNGRVETLVETDLGNNGNNLNLDVPIPFDADTDLSGPWRLTVSDLAAEDVGTLESWSLTVSSVEKSSVQGPVQLELVRAGSNTLAWTIQSPPPGPWNVLIATELSGPWIPLRANAIIDQSSSTIRLTGSTDDSQAFYRLQSQ